MATGFIEHENLWWPGILSNPSAPDPDSVAVQLFPLEDEICVQTDCDHIRAATASLLVAAISKYEDQFGWDMEVTCTKNIKWDTLRNYLNALLQFIEHSGWTLLEVVQDVHVLRRRLLREYAVQVEDIADIYLGVLM
jgi:hypothetical protein